MERVKFYNLIKNLGNFHCIIKREKLKKKIKYSRISKLTCVLSNQHHYCDFIIKDNYPIHVYGFLSRKNEDDKIIRTRSNYNTTFRNKKKKS